MKGWVLDLYPGRPGEMVVWLKDEKGEAVRLVDHWSPSIYIAADDRADLGVPLKVVGQELAWVRVVRRYERITDQETTEVVEVGVKDARRVQQLAGRIERLGPFGTYRLYNADVPPNQSYLYEKDLFPLAYCEVEPGPDGLDWRLDDDVMSYDYRLPSLRILGLDVVVDRQGKMPKSTDRIKEARLKGEEGELTIDSGSEADKILELVRAVKNLDPDFITTRDGDTFLFPYLVMRAEVNGVSEQLSLDRDGTMLRLPAKKGTSFFSYGKIHYKPSAIKLQGRVHIDTSSSFSYSEAGFHGLFELSRICRMPLQTAGRASIGKALSSIQFYQAFKRGILIPWKPTLAERFKDRGELLVADRGGFIFEPKMGLHEGVAELDFNSLYPSIMLRRNISAETVRCSCCPDSDNRVPELGWNVCKKRIGIVPRSMEIIVEKRLRYKELKKNSTGAEREKYDQCLAALKWVGVATFGYLGFNNAKFGRIDAHIAVCAWDRKILVDAARVAERRGFEVIHGIVDSLWLKREGAEEADYLELKAEIEAETGFPLSFEGIYKWIAFLPSKVDAGLPVLNRYFGAYRGGGLKVRGIEARRHDTPLLFKRCQMEILRILADGDTVEDARKRLPQCVLAFEKYANVIEERGAPAEEMAFAMNLSKRPEEYVNRTLQSSVARQLAEKGVDLHAGEGVRYVIRDYQSSGSRRAVPVDFEEAIEYDTKRYVRLLAEACASVLKEFDQRYGATFLVRQHECTSTIS
ncbi:MAG: hypothetical protein LYZ69_03455 [Nitrososphaerales archaeon]|nr:hypothetical protein [Nitrososphaerales archaeon]